MKKSLIQNKSIIINGHNKLHLSFQNPPDKKKKPNSASHFRALNFADRWTNVVVSAALQLV